MADLGLDVDYVLHGTRAVRGRKRLDAAETALLEAWRAAPQPLRDAAMRVLIQRPRPSEGEQA